MIRSKLQATDRAVSPVVGVALLIAIAVILAAVIGAVVLGLGTGGADTPQAQLQAQFTVDSDNNYVEISHNGGEPLPLDEVVINVEADDETDSATLADVADAGDRDDLTAGASIIVGEEEGEGNDFNTEPMDDITNDVTSVSLVWEDPNSDSEHVLESWEN